MTRTALLLASCLLVSCAGAPPAPPAPPEQAVTHAPSPAPAASNPARPAFTMTRAMIPMRDGIRLETVVFAPKDAGKPLPFLFIRTPYGIPDSDKFTRQPGAAPYLADGYIWVGQNLRGRFRSEGTFLMSRPPRDRADPRAVDESTDAHDTIAWLLENVPGNNGRVGMMGTSYDAWTATMALLDPHPALKAIVEEASPADQFLGDDFHHNGAFRYAYGFEYVALLESSKEKNTHFQYDRGDLYDFFLALGPLANADKRHFHGKMPTWNDFVAHPNYDDFWQRQAFATHLRKTTVPVLNVAGWWDQEDFYGPIKIHELLEKNDPERLNYLVVGPWNHGGWGGDGRKLGSIDFGSDTGAHYNAQIKAPWFAHWLHGKGKLAQPEAMLFETGSNRWRSFDAWPAAAGVTRKKLYLRAGRALSFDPPTDAGPAAADSYVSDPASPVPFCPRPIAPLFSGPQWREWLVQDQRFVDGRPDVLSFSTGALEGDVSIAGPITVELHASTTGTDSDWIVKLIDVYPEGAPPPPPPEPKPGAAPPPPPAPDMRGYQLMVAGEVLRGRFRESFTRPSPIPAGKIVKYTLDLHTRSHTFLKGHRIMVQVQSTWFPIIDRNPQRYVASIFQATEADFVPATQKIARSREAPSAVILPVLSP